MSPHNSQPIYGRNWAFAPAYSIMCGVCRYTGKFTCILAEAEADPGGFACAVRMKGKSHLFTESDRLRRGCIVKGWKRPRRRLGAAASARLFLAAFFAAAFCAAAAAFAPALAAALAASWAAAPATLSAAGAACSVSRAWVGPHLLMQYDTIMGLVWPLTANFVGYLAKPNLPPQIMGLIYLVASLEPIKQRLPIFTRVSTSCKEAH